MEWFANALRHHPELALFLALAIGYAVGRIKIGSFQIGSVIGVLVAGVLIGQLGIKVASELKYAFFLLFLFSIGYKTGPQFFRGLKASGLPQAGLTVLACGTGLATAYVVSKALGLDAGTAGGLIAGSLTESATVGTAGDAIAKLAIEDSAKEYLTTKITVAFAVTYFIGLLTIVWLLSWLGPRLLRVDLAAECRSLEEEMGLGARDEGSVSAYYQFIMRAYVVPAALDGKTIAELEGMFPDHRVFVERIRQGGKLGDGAPSMRLQTGDRVALFGRHEALVNKNNPLWEHEAEDRELLDIPTVVVDIVLTSKAIAGKSLGELGNATASRGVFLRTLSRAGQELPFTLRTVVERGDVFTVAGVKHHVERVAQEFGFAEWPTAATDMVTVGAAIFLGGMIGLPALAFGKLEVGLSLAVGVLLGGLVFGWLRSVNPRFGRIPEATLWLFDSVGLTAFLALVGLSAGPEFVRGLRESGVSLVVAGILVAAIPPIVAILVGRHLLRMHPGILLGVCAGACTSAPGLAAVQEVARSKIPTLGYGVSYAVGNVLLALWGSVIVVLMTAT
ncbi:MAG TPA: aspartate-alanine antiporter [Burkholderiales bacterium]|nr:aspartate-alanine antiporter [Burkholderiales bacterium]